jgi:hypothetical protein
LKNFKNTSCTVNKVGITENTISSRGGLTFISRYLEQIKFFRIIDKHLHDFRPSKKAQPVSFIVRQIILFFINGSHKALAAFDLLQKDAGYAAVLEVKSEQLLSSHSVKRFFRKFTYLKCFALRKIINTLFVWRLSVEKPEIIILDIDTMVLDNDDAKKRHGCDVTYKRCKGFQPLQITWNNIMIDAHFRRGSSHSNHGTDVQKALKSIVGLIRKEYRSDIPIIVTCDSGFLDEKNLHYFDSTLGIFFICFGKLYDSVKERVKTISPEEFKEYAHGHKLWQYAEFMSKLDSWKDIESLRTIFTTQQCDENGQMIHEIARPDSVLYTNIGCNDALTEKLIASGNEHLTAAEAIIEHAHQRGNNELCNRSFKDFMLSEKLPFKQFGMNAAYYYFMIIAHMLNESYKTDVVNKSGITHIHLNCYPKTFRRNMIDFAVQIVSSGHEIFLSVMNGLWENLHIRKLWELCNLKNRVPIPIL